MRQILSDISKLTASQRAVLVGLLLVLNVVVIGGLLWLVTDDPANPNPVRQLVLAQANATRTPQPTFTPRGMPPMLAPVQLMIKPTATNTRVPTWTPSITPTPSPTKTGTPIPTDTPAPTSTATDTPEPPAAPNLVPPPPQIVVAPIAPIPAALTVNPNVDFIVSTRQMTPCENQGNHHIFIHVNDQNGNGIPGINVRIRWDGGEAIAKTGDKADPGLTDFAMFKGTYWVELVDFPSESTESITPDIPVDQRCEENGNPVANSFYHYSYEVIFTKVR